MNTLARLDDPLGPPPIEPTAVRRRAGQLRRRRTRRQWAGAAGGALALALAVSLARPDSQRVEIRDDAAATPPASCEPAHRVTRSILVMGGASPADNVQIVDAAQDVLQSHEFAAELRSRLDVDLAARFPVFELAAAISVAREPSSAVIGISVQAPIAADADEISLTVLPSLTAVFEAGQRDLPIEQRLPGPMFQEISTEPTTAEVSC